MLKGHPHPDGHYTGEQDEDGRFLIAANDGPDFATLDTPHLTHVLGGVAHAEYYVKSGDAIIFGLSPIPSYWRQAILRKEIIR